MIRLTRDVTNHPLWNSAAMWARGTAGGGEGEGALKGRWASLEGGLGVETDGGIYDGGWKDMRCKRPNIRTIRMMIEDD
jgi:hypothetical protein